MVALLKVCRIMKGERKINDAIQIVIDFAEQEDKVSRDYMISAIRTEFLGS